MNESEVIPSVLQYELRHKFKIIFNAEYSLYLVGTVYPFDLKYDS